MNGAQQRAPRAERASLALGALCCGALAAAGLAMVAGCSPAKPATAELSAAATGPAAPISAGPPPAAMPSPAAAAPAIASTRRDERTLAAATPYQDRHGKAGCQIADCLQHEAGYKWAALHTLTEEAHCAGLTAAFIDGCKAYARDHRGAANVATVGGQG